MAFIWAVVVSRTGKRHIRTVGFSMERTARTEGPSSHVRPRPTVMNANGLEHTHVHPTDVSYTVQRFLVGGPSEQLHCESEDVLYVGLATWIFIVGSGLLKRCITVLVLRRTPKDHRSSVVPISKSVI